MTDDRKKSLAGIGKYLGVAATVITIIYSGFATLDYAGKWFNQASVAITELGQVKNAIARHEVEQRDELKEIRKELGELRMDITKLLMISRQPEERCKVAGINPAEK